MHTISIARCPSFGWRATQFWEPLDYSILVFTAYVQTNTSTYC